jgi:hypothetical protein
VRPIKPVRFLLCQHPTIDQIGDFVDLVEIFGNPVEGLEVAEPPFAFFDIWLQHVARAAQFGVPRIAFSELSLDEFRPGRVGDFRIETPTELVI